MGLDLALDVAPGIFSGNRSLYFATTGFSITPVVSATNLLVNPGPAFTFTSDDLDGWTETGESGSDPQFTEVGTGEGHAGAGTGAGAFYTSATNFLPSIKQVILTAGSWYQIQAVVSKVTAGYIKADDNSLYMRKAFSTAATHAYTGQATTTSFLIYPDAAPADVTLDSASVKAVTAVHQLFTHAKHYGDFSVQFTDAAGLYQGGITFHYVDDSNFERLYYNTVNGRWVLTKRVAGVFAVVGSGVVTYSAGAVVMARVYPDGITDVLVGGVPQASFAATGLTGVQAGPFKTHASVTLGSYVWDARTMYRYVLYDTFTRANGAIGSSETPGPDGVAVPIVAWNGATWTIATNAAVNTPGVGASLFDADAAAFTPGGAPAGAGTYGWAPSGANTIANAGGELAITYVNNAAGAVLYLRDTLDLTADLTVGRWYKYTVQAKVLAGNSVLLALNDGVAAPAFGTVDGTSLTSYTRLFRAKSATNCRVTMYSMGAGEVLTLDNQALEPLTWADLIDVPDLGCSNVIVWANLTVGALSYAGIVVGADSQANPLNFIYAVIDPSNAILYWLKVLNGVTSELIAGGTAVTYVAGAQLRMEKRGTSYWLSYNGLPIGTVQTISDAAIISNTRHGIFSTDVAGKIDAAGVIAIT